MEPLRDVVWRAGRMEHEGESIYWEEAGPPAGPARPPMVFCHGAGGNHAAWYQQVAHFASSHRVITWDQRGFGRSTRNGDIGPRPAVRDLTALVDHLGVGPAIVVGQSMGGWCALGYALAHPGRVRALVLADTLGGIFTPEIVEILTAQVSPPVFSDPPRLGEHPAIAGLAQKDRAQAFLYQQLSSLGEEIPSLEAVALLLQTQWDLDAVAALDVPTLFLFGGSDNLFPPDALRAAASLVPAAAVAEIPGCTHSPYFEAAAEWNGLVESFVGRHSPAEE
ncbi:MAG: alpha/beta hydrolase [Actinobacteria bacterium]|nr:alpha/beta hydrolase [Actinomycetota bacterium]